MGKDQENEIDRESPKPSIFEFTPDMSVGNETIDSDHKAFFDLSKLLSETLQTGERGMVVLSSLAILEEYVDGHFHREEKAMRKVNYSNLAEHRLKHNQFRARIKAISEVYRQGTTSAADDLPPLVIHWLRSHIANEDQRYKRWINSSAVDDRPLVYLAMEAEHRN
ncbi:bacteriohemerythrin [Magnetospirillum sp. SS-4]|uniref:bacteriohemerythrin n=1 Tax=Magnetospirillum sp. SS-4 TaxID=2681465 RepID=UPI0013859147|nr:hemerythrin family protein [Magnetospirillum sp. SS-4]CAA7627445.1 Hemerythrin-like protein [Magnetospirillum sp. SS-4]